MRTSIKLAFLASLLGMLWGCTKDALDILPADQEESIEMRGSAIQGQIFAPGGLEEFELSDPEAIQKLGGNLSRVRFTARPQAMPYAYLITTDEDVILHVSQSNLLDLASLMAEPGVYRIWAFAYKGGILAKPGMHVHDAVLAGVSFQPTSNFIRVSNRIKFLRQYAPQLRFHPDEKYFPSSVEWAFQFLFRWIPDDERGPGKPNRYWLHTIRPLPVEIGTFDYSAHMDFFRGNLLTAKTYAYWVERPEVEGGVIDLVYFNFYPWNRGKQVASTTYGHHVGDWEDLVVRLRKVDGKFVPYKVYYGAHGKVRSAPLWSDAPKTADGHPVVYVAKGSHGYWETTGNDQGRNDYFYGGITGTLWDDCSDQGIPWHTRNTLEMYDYSFIPNQGDEHRKERLDGAAWPRWMDTDYTTPGPDPDNPASGPIWRWGNDLDPTGEAFGYNRLDDGPTGPVEKPEMKNRLWNPVPCVFAHGCQ